MDSDDVQTEQQPAQRRPTLRERIGRRPAWVRSAALVTAGLIAGGVIAGTVAANAADDGRPGPGSSVSREADRGGHGHHGGHGDPSQWQRDDEELLTGDSAAQVTEAVLAEYPGAEVERVETDSGGVYEAHIVTTDDERLTVLVDEDFEVTGTEERGD